MRLCAAIAVALLLAGGGAPVAAADGLRVAQTEDPNSSSSKNRVPRSEPGEATVPAPSSKEDTQGERLAEVVVTGSLIKRSPEASSQLVTVISSEEIERRGATNATEILAAISQNQPVEVPNSFTASGTGLASYANLRSLGSESTLVLFGGRRIVNDPYQNKAVDLNTVPVALIERVDVLSDGASSIYGSDAIAGVINFIMRDEFTGVQLAANTLQPQQRGGQGYTGSATVGFGSLAADGWNLYAGGMARSRKQILATDRRFSNTSYLPQHGVDRTNFDTFPMNVSQFDEATQTQNVDTLNPFFDRGCAPPRSLPLEGTCKNDNAIENGLQNPEEQRSIVTKLSGRFREQHASLEYFWAQSKVTSAISSNQLDGFLAPNNPYYPGKGITPAIPGVDPTLPVEAFGRFPAAGPRTTDSLSYTDRVLGQLNGEVAAWGYELWALQSRSKVKLRATGQGILLSAGVDDAYTGANGAPFLNPFGDQTPAFMDYLKTIQFKGTLQSATGELSMAGFQLTRDLFRLPGGMVSTALAFEYGRDKVAFANAVDQNLVLGFFAPGSDVAAQRARHSITGEVLIPLFERLEIDTSVRQDRYENVGSTVNPKILATFKVIENVLSVHGSYNTGFRAPTLYELYRPQDLGFAQVRHNDPVLCPGGVVDTALGGVQSRDCNAVTNTLTGANPDLKPIESNAFAVGFDWKPLRGLVLSVNYWDYKVDKTVGVLSDVTIFNDPSRFGNYIVRCSQSDPKWRDPNATGCNANGTAFNGPGDPIAYINQFPTNIGQTKTNGVDFGMNWAKDLAIGTLALDYRGTYINKYEFQDIPGDPFVSRAGVYTDGAPMSKYSHYTTLSWERGALNAQLQNRLSGGYIDFNNGNPWDKTYEFYHEVRAYSLWNLSASYRYGEAWTFTASVRNLFNTDPPFTNKVAGVGTGYDERIADPTGRAFGLAVSARFGGHSNY